jgi:hypothetical protein
LVTDVAASVCGLLLLLLLLAAFNERFREQFSQGASADGAGVAVLDQLSNVALLVGLAAAQVVREQSVEHVSLMAFAGAALVFVIFLLRM